MAFNDTGGIDVARELIPARVRRGLYAASSLAGYGLAATAVGMTAASGEVPQWVTVALATLGALIGPIGQLAATNTRPAAAVVLPETVLPEPAPLFPVDDGDEDTSDSQAG